MRTRISFRKNNAKITCYFERCSAEPSNGEPSGLTVGEVSKHTTVLAKPTEQRKKSLVILSVVLSALLGAPLIPVLTAENDLAHADGFRGDFHALVLVGKVQGLFEAHLDRRSQGFEHVCGGGTHIGHMLGQCDVHIKLVRLVIYADDLALVHRRLRSGRRGR